MPEKPSEVVLLRQVSDVIHTLRGQQIMLDEDLATLYGVETRVLNQAVKRSRDRFPADFMFQVTSEEWTNFTAIP